MVDGYEAVLFDAGGTLVHLDYVFMARCAAGHGARVSAAALEHAEARARREVDRRARSAGGVDQPDERRRGSYFLWLLEAAGLAPPLAERILADLQEAHAAENLWRVPLPGAAETLEALRERGLRTAVVSNADGRVETTLAALGLTAHLELVVDSRLEGVEKPDPEIFRRALARLEVAPSRALYVGDIYAIDAVGSRAAGLSPVVIDTTGSYDGLDCPTIGALGELLR